MKQDTIKIKGGHELIIKGIQIRETYDEILVGAPELEDNIRIYDRLDVPANWYVRKCVYSMKSFNLDKKKFLPYTVYVWVSSDKSVNDPKKQFDGSELVIIGTIDSINNFSVQELIEDVLKDFDWERYAINIRF
jgi:hypothetical protein